MPSNPLLNQALACLQNTLANELYNDLKSDRCREFALCAVRVLARLRIDLEAAPDIATAQLPVWEALASSMTLADTRGASQPVSAVETLNDIAAAIGADLDRRGADNALLDGLWTPLSAGTSRFTQATAAARDYLDAIEQALPVSDSRVEQPVSDPETIRNKLTRYLARRFPELPPDPIRAFRIVPGGRGKETALFELAPNPTLPQRLVLRRDIANSPTGTTVYAEFPLLQKLESLGLPVPTPIAAEKDPAVLGGGFMIVTEAIGAHRAGELFAEMNDLGSLDPSFGVDLTHALARLHTLTEHPSGSDLGGHHALSDPMAAVRQFQGIWRSLTHRPAFALATDLGFAWLLGNPPPADRPQRLVHSDVGLHNILVRDGKLAALLDWELTHLGDPAEDIGYVRAPLMQHLLPWPQFVATYVEAGGDPAACDKRAVDWYSVWAHTRNSIYVAMHHEWATTGQRRDIESFNAAIDFFARTQLYIARELQVAEQG